MRYEFTKPEEYRAIKATVPIAYLPWGAHEWHGLHNPLGLDTLKVHGICQALCAATGGIADVRPGRDRAPVPAEGRPWLSGVQCGQ